MLWESCSEVKTEKVSHSITVSNMDRLANGQGLTEFECASHLTRHPIENLEVWTEFGHFQHLSKKIYCSAMPGYKALQF